MRFETLKIDEIRPYQNNPRKNDEAVDLIAKSIEQCSYLAPIVVDEDHVILAGHARYKALRSLNYEEAEVLICEGLDEEQKKKYRFLDNKTGEKATWDLMKLEIELEGIDLEGFDFFGMNESFDEEPRAPKEAEGSIEYDTGGFDDEKFKYTCPNCGFRFN